MGVRARRKKGHCPECGGVNLDYGALEVKGDQVYYPFTCDDCGLEGKEWYSLEYTESTVKHVEDLEEEIRHCPHDFLFESVITEGVERLEFNEAFEGITDEIKKVFCCNKCGGYLVVQETAEGGNAWIAYPSEYPELY